MGPSMSFFSIVPMGKCLLNSSYCSLIFLEEKLVLWQSSLQSILISTKNVLENRIPEHFSWYWLRLIDPCFVFLWFRHLIHPNRNVQKGARTVKFCLIIIILIPTKRFKHWEPDIDIRKTEKYWKFLFKQSEFVLGFTNHSDVWKLNESHLS